MIIRGTTQTHTFTVPFQEADVAVIYVTYAQSGATIVEKTGSDITFDDTAGEISLDLTQADTLLFAATTTKDCFKDKAVSIQIRARLNDGKVLASIEMYETVANTLKSGVI